MADREELSWDQFGAATRQLAASVRTDGFAPDLILAIVRGGLFIAGALGYALDVKNVHMMNVEYYTGADQRLDAPVMLPPLPNVAEVRCAVVYQKPQSEVDCEYVWRRTDLWIDFPWTNLKPSKS
jgi:uncharacterized protein